MYSNFIPDYETLLSATADPAQAHNYGSMLLAKSSRVLKSQIMINELRYDLSCLVFARRHLHPFTSVCNKSVSPASLLRAIMENPRGASSAQLCKLAAIVLPITSKGDLNMSRYWSSTDVTHV